MSMDSTMGLESQGSSSFYIGDHNYTLVDKCQSSNESNSEDSTDLDYTTSSSDDANVSYEEQVILSEDIMTYAIQPFDKLQYVESSRGCKQLVYQGFLYDNNQYNWRCINRKCQARLKFIDNRLHHYNFHDHDVHDVQIAQRIFAAKLKKCFSEYPHLTSKEAYDIKKDEISIELANLGFDPSFISDIVKSYTSYKSSIDRVRRKNAKNHGIHMIFIDV